MDTKREQNGSTTFTCIKCHVKCSKKYNYDRHCLTARHKRIHLDTLTEQIEEYVCHCGNKYKYSQGLSKHKKSVV